MRIAIQLSLRAQSQFSRLQELNPLVPRAVLLRDCAEDGLARKLAEAEALHNPAKKLATVDDPLIFVSIAKVAAALTKMGDEQPLTSSTECEVAGNPFEGIK